MSDDAERVAVTGTPGTGKTSATTLLDGPVVHLNDLIREAGLWSDRDEDRDSLVADLDAVREALGDWTGVVESHLAHHLDADRVVVLRCHPDTLADRLREPLPFTRRRESPPPRGGGRYPHYRSRGRRGSPQYPRPTAAAPRRIRPSRSRS